MILSSLLILALIVSSGILLSSMLLPFQLPRAIQEAQANPCSIEAGGATVTQNDDQECDLTGSFEFEEGIGSLDIEEESATLSVCKEMTSNSLGQPSGFAFTVTGNNPEPDEFLGDPNCVDVTIGPGEYAVSEVNNVGGALISVSVEGQCMQDPTNELRATGEIQAGETQECRFINFVSD